MKEILVVANRTLGGERLLDAVRARAASGETRFRLVVPASPGDAARVVAWCTDNGVAMLLRGIGVNDEAYAR